MTVIIVDDEPRAIELLCTYLAHFANFELLATFRNGLKAMTFLNAHAVDVVFLDINMPHLNGLSLAKMIDPSTRVIFTTAYAEYAVESYDVEAVDYLLKPISLERFTKAISKMLTTTAVSPASKPHSLLVKSGTKIFRVAPADILYLAKDGNYLTYHTREQKIMARASAAEALAELPAHFLQIHKSYIVNVQHVEFIERNEIAIAGTRLPIGRAFKEEVLKILLS